MVVSKPVPAHAGGWPEVSREHGFEPIRTSGRVPTDLSGTLFRNGPGRFETHGQRVPHPFDGDGAIAAARFSNGQVEGAVRFIASPGLAEERRRGRHLGGYGLISGYPMWDVLRGNMRNVANTSVLPYGSDLLALWEGGLPTAVDPATLDTRGVTDLGCIPGSFSAHPHRHPSGAWVNHGLRLGRVNTLDLFWLPPAGPPRLLRSERIGPAMVHDFALTERFAVFFLSPLILDLWSLMRGRRAFGDALDWRPERGTEVLVLPLDGGPSCRFFTEPFYQWHFANAWEEGDTIVVDFARYPDFEINEVIADLYRGMEAAPAMGRLCRAKIEPSRETVSFIELAAFSAEFCTVAPGAEGRRTEVLYTASHRSGSERGPLDEVARVEPNSGAILRTSFGEGHFVLEPLFCPTDTGGWLVAPVTDALAQKSFFAILEPESLEEVGRIHFEQALPTSFHGRWLPA